MLHFSVDFITSGFQDTSEPPDSMATKDRPGSEEFVMDDINATGSGLSQNDDNENITTLKVRSR